MYLELLHCGCKKADGQVEYLFNLSGYEYLYPQRMPLPTMVLKALGRPPSRLELEFSAVVSKVCWDVFLADWRAENV